MSKNRIRLHNPTAEQPPTRALPGIISIPPRVDSAELETFLSGLIEEINSELQPAVPIILVKPADEQSIPDQDWLKILDDTIAGLAAEGYLSIPQQN